MGGATATHFVLDTSRNANGPAVVRGGYPSTERTKL